VIDAGDIQRLMLGHYTVGVLFAHDLAIWERA